MKSIKKLITLTLVLATIFMSVAVPAYAAGSERTSVSSVTVNTGNDFYVVHGRNIPVKTKASGGSTDFKLQQGALIKICGSEGSSYKVDLNGTVRYISKESARKVSSVKGEIYITTKDSPLRPQPYEGKTTATLPKNTALVVVGTLVNSKGNCWMAVYYNSGIHYIYEKNIKHVEKLSLNVSASSHELNTLGKIQMTATVTPSANVVWSSSNPSVASVNIAGVVTGHTAGKTTITASINNITQACWELTVTRNVELDVKAYRQSTDYTCSAASTLAVLNYYGKEIGTKDTAIYGSINGYVGNITKVLNNRLGSETYAWSIVNDVVAYENAIYHSLRQGSPVIARVCFKNGYFNYASGGHYTVVVGMYKDSSGQIWLNLVDSYVDRYSSNDYTNKNTGEVRVPLKELFKYGTYNGASDIYLIYNP